MEDQRQLAFKKLRAPCVKLSEVGLQFKTHQASVKDVFYALSNQHQALQDLGTHDRLDTKLAEYAFFPLTHVLNESQRLSSDCLEITARSVTILVSRGWRQHIAPEMAKQLLILMSLLAGGDPRKQSTAPTDELKIAAFDCMASIIEHLASTPSAGRTVFDDQATRNVVDQLVYLLAEVVSENANDTAQLAASGTLLQLFRSMNNRVFLASLLPRTVSSLVKALRPSTHARRTHKVLCANLILLKTILSKVLGGNVIEDIQNHSVADAAALDDTWLQATATQVRNALIQVTRLRNQNRAEVRDALGDLCTAVIKDCSTSLPESLPNMIETLVILSSLEDGERTNSALKHLLTSRSDLLDYMRTGFYDWTQSLPRIMQANEDGPKELMIRRIASAFTLITEQVGNNDNIINNVTLTLLNSTATSIEQDQYRQVHIHEKGDNSYLSLEALPEQPLAYQPVVMGHQSQRASSQHLQLWIRDLQQHPGFGRISRAVVDAFGNTTGNRKVAAAWLAVNLLKKGSSASFDIEDLFLTDVLSDRSTSRAFLVHDLYSLSKDLLTNSSPYSDTSQDWRLAALSLEALVLQADQLGTSYRSELYETLYPVLALFSSKNDILQNNAVSTLNLLASACQYSSAKEMLIENVDYLVNSIAWKLNTFNLSPEAPQVLNMMIKLVGARLIPYLDDLIGSIFAALDSYHGYPAWVEMLFSALKSIVDESTKSPSMVIDDGNRDEVKQAKSPYRPGRFDDIKRNLRARKKRELVHEREDTISSPEQAPHRPWTKELDDANYQPPANEEDLSLESIMKQDQDADLPAPTTNQDEDQTAPKSKQHDLLLKIAQATAPHLASPSPRVRHLLLELLIEISPLLSRHENTFLPLINAIWPAIVPRLLAQQQTSPSNSTDTTRLEEFQDENAELPYNISAAARVITAICKGAGDFMSGRIDQIMPQLVKLFQKTHLEVEATFKQNTRLITPSFQSPFSSSLSATNPINSSNTQDKLKGTVDLKTIIGVQRSQEPNTILTTSSAIPEHPTQIRTTQSQVLKDLTTLLTTILTHVSTTPDQADLIVDLLSPFITPSSSNSSYTKSEATKELSAQVKIAIENYNPDLLWVIEQRGIIEGQIDDGSRQVWDRIWEGSEDGTRNGAPAHPPLREVVF